MFTRRNDSYLITPDLLASEINVKNSPISLISSMIPEGAKVLDIGAGNGILASVLHAHRTDIVIDGIEPNPYAAALAKAEYRHFYVGFCQEYFKEIIHENYDFIILADVIEHVADPLKFLKELTSVISFNTKVIISTPNIGFGAIKLSLMKGQFQYADTGILERTHLRFFTADSLEALVSTSELHIEKMIYLQRSYLKSETQLEAFKISPLLFHEINKDPLSFTYQFLLVLSKGSCNVERKFVGDIGKFHYLKYLRLRHVNAPIVKLLMKALAPILTRVT